MLDLTVTFDFQREFWVFSFAVFCFDIFTTYLFRFKKQILKKTFQRGRNLLSTTLLTLGPPEQHPVPRADMFFLSIEKIRDLRLVLRASSKTAIAIFE